jgi:diacylglycerol kinase (ATP)
MTMTDNKEKDLLLIINPKAGTMQASKRLSEILQVFSDEGYLTRVHMTSGSGDARDFAERYAHEVSVIACAGGDGTLNEVIEGVVASGADCAIGYIPAGSTNDFAAGVGLPKSVIEAARVIATGVPADFDAGSFNGKLFSYVASFGAFTSTSYSVPQNMKNIMGHAAYMLQGAKDITNIKKIAMDITIDEGTENETHFNGDYLFVAACNSTSIAGVLKLDRYGVDMNDDLLELLLFEAPENIVELSDMVRALLDGTLIAKRIRIMTVHSAKITMDGNINWTLDGEYAEGCDEITIDAVHSAYKLIVPPDFKSQ